MSDDGAPEVPASLKENDQDSSLADVEKDRFPCASLIDSMGIIVNGRQTLWKWHSLRGHHLHIISPTRYQCTLCMSKRQRQ